MTRPGSSDAVTEGVRVQASAQFRPAESEPERGHYVWAYRITITNESDRRVRLRSRHWIILDADNRREDVRGAGVVGKQPVLAPGEKFEYTSGCPLRTAWGTMEGSYTMEKDDASTFEAAIGRFFLVPPPARVRG